MGARDFERTMEILLVDDNAADVALLKENLKHSRFAVNVGVARDGQEALDYLYHKGRFPYCLEPDLIVLDLNLPKKNGWVILGEIKRDIRLCDIPVLILTGSGYEADEKLSHQLKADLYMVKPTDMLHFPPLVQSIDRLLAEQLNDGGPEPAD